MLLPLRQAATLWTAAQKSAKWPVFELTPLEELTLCKGARTPGSGPSAFSVHKLIVLHDPQAGVCARWGKPGSWVMPGVRFAELISEVKRE